MRLYGDDRIANLSTAKAVRVFYDDGTLIIDFENSRILLDVKEFLNAVISELVEKLKG